MKTETYEEMRERHEREVREWVQRVFAGDRSVKSVSKETGVNPGTLSRLKHRLYSDA